MKIDLQTTVERLKNGEDILILSHQNPDGDTLGTAFGLMHTLHKMGKRARVECSDDIPARFSFLVGGKTMDSFSPKMTVAVDVADLPLLGKLKTYEVDLCIDHHPSNSEYAKELYLVEHAAAAAEAMVEIVEQLGVEIDPLIASCLYTGVSTDTGCFRYSNTSENTHKVAARLIAYGADHTAINQLMFETNSRQRLKLTCLAMESLEYFYDNRCAMMEISQEMLQISGAKEDELDGISAIPRQIEGVEVGIMIREKADKSGYRISVRTANNVDASALCGKFGGGGHKRAAGCTLHGTPQSVRQQLSDAMAEYFSK